MYMILYMYISTDVEAFDVLGTILPSILKGIKVKNEVCMYITITSSSS